MALVTCSDCETKVSDQAAACPQCGRPVERAEEDKKASPLLGAGVGLFAVGAILLWGVGGFVGMCGILGMLAGGVLTLVGWMQKPK